MHGSSLHLLFSSASIASTHLDPQATSSSQLQAYVRIHFLLILTRPLMLVRASSGTVGYVIGQVPSNLILTRVSPHIVIPAVSRYQRLTSQA